jgi:single-stranded DNA-binding protein
MLANRMEKGALVAVEGTLQYDTFTDKEGVEKTVANIVADKIRLLTRPRPQEEKSGDAE